MLVGSADVVLGVGCPAVVLDVLPVVEVCLCLEIDRLLDLDLADSAPHGDPALHIVRHERVAWARKQIPRRDLCEVGRVGLAVEECELVVSAGVHLALGDEELLLGNPKSVFSALVRQQLHIDVSCL